MAYKNYDQIFDNRMSQELQIINLQKVVVSMMKRLDKAIDDIETIKTWVEESQKEIDDLRKEK